MQQYKNKYVVLEGENKNLKQTIDELQVQVTELSTCKSDLKQWKSKHE